MIATRQTSLKFFGKLRWLNGTPLLPHIEPYRRKIFSAVLDGIDAAGRPQYTQALLGRAKKNWKSADLILAALFKLVGYDSPGGNQCYLLANDEDQAGDDLTLAKKLIAANPLLVERLEVKQKEIVRGDGKGFLQILPAGDVAGQHGKTFCFVGHGEIHSYPSYDILEAMASDPTRKDVLIWITSYASLHHHPGAPLYDYYQRGVQRLDPKMFFSWYSGSFGTDPTSTSLDRRSGRTRPSAASKPTTWRPSSSASPPTCIGDFI